MSYEDNKQKMIIRQSQSKLVLDYANSCGKCITIRDLVAITEVLTDYVTNGYSKELGDRLTKIDEHIKTL